jgi:hypothetical protein
MDHDGGFAAINYLDKQELSSYIRGVKKQWCINNMEEAMG